MVTATMTNSEMFHSSKEMEQLMPYFIIQGTDEELQSRLAGGNQPTAEIMAERLNGLEEDIKNNRSVLLDLYSEEEKKANPSLNQTKLIFCRGKENAPYALVIPGGAFLMVAVLGEGVPAAYEINRGGYNAFILKYRIGEDDNMAKALEDVNRAFEVIEKKSKELKIDVEKPAIVGFSAGAHVASMWAVKEYGYGKYEKEKPTALLCGYPAFSMNMFYEDFNQKIGNDIFLWVSDVYLKRIYGENYEEKDVPRYSLENHITKDFSPIYMVHGLEDEDVHVRSSRLVEKAIIENHVVSKVIYKENMGHSFGIGLDTPAEGWLTDALKFWRDLV